jgi:hypothetical protein
LAGVVERSFSSLNQEGFENLPGLRFFAVGQEMRIGEHTNRLNSSPYPILKAYLPHCH